MDKTIVIAEAGVNHNGSIEQAKKLVEIAAKAGADYVKFQTFKADNLVSKHAEKAEYQKAVTNKDESHYEMIKKLELDYEMHLQLIDFSNKMGINFLSTPFDIKSIKLLVDLGLEKIKIPSGEITNLPYLRYAGSMNKPVLMSTGMATLNEVQAAMKILLEVGLEKDNLIIMHCVTEYPAPMDEVNLQAMLTIRDELGVRVGYSDHTRGIEISVAAVAMGATVIEKHFTLDRSLSGPDHAASLEPSELKAMISSIRNVEKAMGNGIKLPSKSEEKNILIARKSIVAKYPIKRGDIFTERNLTTKRPSTGISPMEWDNIIGKTSNYDFETDDIIAI